MGRGEAYGVLLHFGIIVENPASVHWYQIEMLRDTIGGVEKSSFMTLQARGPQQANYFQGNRKVSYGFRLENRAIGKDQD